MGQAIQMLGALVVLAAFVANQWFRLPTDNASYLLMNAVGTGILAVVAGVNGDMGFLLLEGVWAIVSTIGLTRALLGRTSAETG
ncbi:MAG TPA: hypothetical protein VHU88_14255 [Sporichthyaceae bacterium]|nr:hypothetical protein [Sporichthyaceae bacterium]